ncbi:TPA: hypothetical protein ACUSXM_003052, partial [Escherichia coli]
EQANPTTILLFIATCWKLADLTHTHRSKRAPVLPLHICERQQSFLCDCRYGKRLGEKSKRWKSYKKKSRDTSHKTTPPEGGVLLLLLIPV